MIQRIQSIYLFLIVIICVLMFFLPVYQGSVSGGAGGTVSQTLDFRQNLVSLTPRFKTDNPGNIEFASLLLNIVDIVILILASVAIGLFKNRKVQLRLSRYLLLLSFIYLGIMIFGIIQAKALLVNANDHYGAGASIPVLTVILAFLAIRGISKDIKLVKSTDRLR